MEISKITVTTLDNKTEVLVDLANDHLHFVVRPMTESGQAEHFNEVSEAIVGLWSRGYLYAEELVRLAVSALKDELEVSYAA